MKEQFYNKISLSKKNILSHGAIYLLLLIFLIPQINLKAQGFFGTPSQVLKAQMLNNLKKSANSLLDYSSAKRSAEEHINEVRDKYWMAIKNGKESKILEEEYQELLFHRDMYFLVMDLLKDFDKSLRSNNTTSNRFDSSFDVLDWLSGGELDGGISPFAKNDFSIWYESVKAHWLKQSKSYFNLDGLTEAIEASQDLYVQYVEKRNIAEYLFYNPDSPLKSNDPYTIYKGILLSGSVCTDEKSLQKYIDGFFKWGSKNQIIEGVKTYSQGKYGDLFNYLKVKGHTSPVVEYVEWSISKNDDTLYALHLIKKKFSCDWDTASKILENRKKRYGYQEFQNSIKQLKEEGQNKNFVCTGMVYSNTKDARLVTYDCSADYLSSHCIWSDLVDLATLEVDMISLRNEFKKAVTKFYDYFDIKNSNFSENYSFLIKNVPEKDLLNAYYIQTRYGQNLLRSDRNGFRGKVYDKESLPDLASKTLQLLIGMSYASENYELYFSLLLHRLNGRNTKLEKAVEKFNEYCNQYGRDVVLEAIKKAEYDNFVSFYGRYKYDHWVNLIEENIKRSSSGFSSGLSEIIQRLKTENNWTPANAKYSEKDFVGSWNWKNREGNKECVITWDFTASKEWKYSNTCRTHTVTDRWRYENEFLQIGTDPVTTSNDLIIWHNVDHFSIIKINYYDLSKSGGKRDFYRVK